MTRQRYTYDISEHTPIEVVVVTVIGIYSLKDDTALIDIGSTITSYIGLLLLSCSFISISIFSSVLSNNQIVSFIISIFICFFLFFINEFFDFINDPKVYDMINYIGIKEHYFSLNQGIISIKDISYFFALNEFSWISHLYQTMRHDHIEVEKPQLPKTTCQSLSYHHFSDSFLCFRPFPPAGPTSSYFKPTVNRQPSYRRKDS